MTTYTIYFSDGSERGPFATMEDAEVTGINVLISDKSKVTFLVGPSDDRDEDWD